MKDVLIPEQLTKIDTTLKFEEVYRDLIVSARVLSWDSQRKGVYVRFGNDIKAYISKEDISIYPSELEHIIGKKILAQVLKYDASIKSFVLSRYNTMNMKLEEFENQKIVSARIRSITDHNIFVDLGAGISGKVHKSELSSVYISDIKDLGFKEGDEITLKVIKISPNGMVELSRKAAYRSFKEVKLDKGDKVKAKIVGTILTKSRTGCEYCYSLEVNNNPNLKGILDSYVPFEMGTEINGIVRNKTKNAFKIKNTR